MARANGTYVTEAAFAGSGDGCADGGDDDDVIIGLGGGLLGLEVGNDTSGALHVEWK